ncbi:hypothetical protein [Sedimenticola thiotaurini]|uniref:GTPase n=1 Tax=Sedimenticola thiotaurini TaxID=1543721 RepID=A0A0F7K042_9GAMM|nr:hypothetical protein [Sedimenticola thiotaurini]AKH20969.1 hypothetical protein AAY24_12110 [Sedimenticola thiotaurini]
MPNSNNPYLLPKRLPPASGDDTFEPKRFKQLVEQLPVGNIGQVSRSLRQLLTQMNASVVPVSSRVSNLELLLKPLLVAIDALAQSVTRASLPLNKRTGTLMSMYESLCILAAQGYKVVLDQYHHESLTGQFLHKSNRALALHRVLYFLGRRLLLAFQLYRPAPPFIWKEIHGIHRYGFDMKLANRSIAYEDQGLHKQASLNDLYKQLLLLSLAGPYRLMQGEVTRVYQALSRWAPVSRLLELGQSDGEVGPFMVDIGVDEAPRYMGAERDHQVLRGWVLDTGEMAVRLAEELEATGTLRGAMRPQDAPDKLSPDLLARLMLTWGIGSRRVVERDQTQGEVALICGLRGIYTELGGEPVQKTAGPRPAFDTAQFGNEGDGLGGIPHALLEADEYIIQDDPELQSIRRWIADNNAPAMQKVAPSPAVTESAETVPRPVPRHCPVYNQSASGYHLGWVDTEASISVGELVAVTHRDGEGMESLRLGVIRWMRAERPDLIDFGVELINGEALPVLFCRRSSRSRQDDYWPGLLLQHPNEDQTIITTPFYSEPGQRSWLVVGGEKRPIVLLREIEATASFIQFYYHDPAQSERPGAESGELDEADFDQLWKTL